MEKPVLFFFDRDDTLLFLNKDKQDKILKSISKKLKFEEARFKRIFDDWNRDTSEQIVLSWKEINNKDKEIDFWYKAFESLYSRLFPSHDSLLNQQEAVMMFYNKLLYFKLYDVFDDVIETLEKLRNDNYKMGVISDTLPMLKESLDHYNISQYFGSFTAAADIGHVKPSREIFERAKTSLNAQGQKIIFIDDRPEKLEGLENIGVTGILIDRTGSYPDHKNSINALSEIFNHL